MKKTILSTLFILPLLTFAQWTQIGADVDGEAAGDYSGSSLSLSANGDFLAIGSPYNDSNGVDSGQVRVYQNLAGVWTQIGSDIVGEAAGDRFGGQVSLSSDGAILAVGGYLNDGNGANSGHVRIYENLSGIWTQIGADIDGESAGDQSGFRIALNSDGTIVAIGSAYNDGNGTDSGHVRVYESQSGTWVQIGADINGEAAFDWSGSYLDLNSNGNIVAIGAILNNGNGSNSGHVRIFENLSGIWTQIGTDIDGEAVDDYSGIVSINSDGNIVAIGADRNDGNGVNSGHVRIYENLAGVWTQIGTDIDGEAVDDKSGSYVSLNTSGNIVAIGAPNNDGNGSNSGHVRIYQNISGIWTQIGTDIDGETINDTSGRCIDLSYDGSIVAIGAIINADNGLDSGHVRVFSNATLNIEENDFGVNFSIYPNPSYGNSKIQLGESFNEVAVEIFNSLGKLVESIEYQNISSFDLDTQIYPTGIYVIHVQSGNKKAIIKLMVK